MNYKLLDVASFISIKIQTDDITIDEYISTENMLQDKGGVMRASSLPSTPRTNSFQMGDVLFSNIRTYFRKVWFSTFDGGVSNDVLVIRSLDENTLFDKYLYYLLSSEEFIRYTVKTAKGTKMPRGDKTAIMNYELNLPSLPTQKKIAHILSTLDEKIELNRKMNQILEDMAQSLFKSWFVDFDPVHAKAGSKSDVELEKAATKLGISKEILEQFPNEFEESEIGMIPKGWKLEELGSLTNITSSKRIFSREYTENGVPFYRSKEIILLAQGNAISDILYISKERFAEIKSKFLVPKAQDILIYPS
jgi:type I restriction enzyme S subunit